MLDRPILPAPYPRQMEDHFIRLGEDLRLARANAGDAPARWQAEHMLRRLLGLPHGAGFADDQPLNARTVGVLSRDGYRIEKVVYESRPGFHVTGALYLPDLPYPVPGVLCPHGHWPDGRYNPEVQRRCVGLARRGYVALSIDKVGYQDREAQDHRSRIGLLSGLTTQAIQVYDNQRGIDLLCNRPEVLADRIGCTGCSGGGNQTMYVSALDSRIQAAAPVCSVEMGESYLHKRFCTCEIVPGLLRHFDLPDICGLIAPRALLLVHGTLDGSFRVDSARKAFRAIQRIYADLGCPERVAHLISYDKHNYNAEMRAAVYDFFDLHLKGLEQPGPAPDEEVIESPADLRCLPDGLPAGHHTLVSLARQAVAEAGGGVRRFGVSREISRFDTVPDSAAAWRDTARRLRAHADRQVLHWPEHPTPLRVRSFGTAPYGDGDDPRVAERLLYHSEPDVIVPACHIRHADPAAESPTTMIWLGDDGQAGIAAADLRTPAQGSLPWYPNHLLLDPRGTGETRSNDPQAEWQAYLSSVTIGRHIAVMRAWDVRRSVDYLAARQDAPLGELTLVVKGDLFSGLVGLLAAAWEPRIQRVVIDTLLAGYGEEIDFGELGSAGQNAIVPRMLAAGLDIGRLMALVAPRALTIHQFVDGCGRPTQRRPADLHYCRQVYELLDAAAELVLP